MPENVRGGADLISSALVRAAQGMLLLEDWESWVMQADAGEVLTGCGMVVTQRERKKDAKDLPFLLSVRPGFLYPLWWPLTSSVRQHRSDGGREGEE